MRTLTYFILIILVLTYQKYEAQNNIGIVSKIESQQIEDQLMLKATASNNTSTYSELNYLFVSIKKGGSGNLSNNKQSGKFTLRPNETKVLSQMSVNVQKNDALKIFLFIKDEQTGKLLSKDSLEINSKNFASKLDQSSEEEEFSELGGLTIDQTKTKTGKDFYDLFYLEYSKLPQKLNSPVTINELPTMGRGSQIVIEVDDKTIYNFIANPNEEYLAEQANMTMKFLMEYTYKKSLIKNEFRY